MLTPHRRAAWAVTLAASLLVGWATLTPQGAGPARGIFCMLCGQTPAVDVALNIALFLPLGVGLRLLGRDGRRAILIAAAASLAIEILQLAIPGRDTSLRDLLSNTLGAALGVGLASSWRSWTAPNPATAQRLLIVAVGAWCAMVSGSAWLLAPSFPDSTYWGQWAPELGMFAPFRGTVLSASLNSEALPPRQLTDTPHRRALMISRGPRLTAAVSEGLPTVRLAPVVSIFDREQQEIVLLGQEGRDLILRSRLRAAAMGMRSIGLRLPMAFAEHAGADTLRLSGGLTDGVLWTRAERRDEIRQARLALTPSLIWIALLPVDHAFEPAHAHWWSWLWLAGLALPFGWWSVAARGRRPGAGFSLGIVIAATVVIPRCLSLNWAWWDGGAALAGIVLGALAATALPYRNRALGHRSPGHRIPG